MTHIWKRSFSFLMALVMVFSMLPLNTFAAETEPVVIEETNETQTVLETETVPESEAATETTTETTAPAGETQAPPETEAAGEAETADETEAAEETEAPAPEETVAEETEPQEEELLGSLLGEISAVSQLQNDLNAFQGTSFPLPEDLDVIGNEKLSVPSGMILSVSSHTLTIPKDASLEIDGNVEFADDGQLLIHGTLTNKGTINFRSGGSATVNGVLNNNAIISVQAESDESDGEGILNVNGTLNILRNASGYNGLLQLGGTMNVAKGGIVTVDGVSGNGGMTANEGTINISGALSTTIDLAIGTLEVTETTLTVPAGVTMTVEKNLQVGSGSLLEINGTLEQNGTAVMGSGSKINIHDGGALNVSGAMTLETSLLDDQGKFIPSAEVTIMESGRVTVDGALTNQGVLQLNAFENETKGAALTISSEGKLYSYGNIYLGKENSVLDVYGEMLVQRLDNGNEISVILNGKMTIYESGTLCVEHWRNCIVHVEPGAVLTVEGKLTGEGIVDLVEGGTISGVETARQQLSVYCETAEEMEAYLATAAEYHKIDMVFCGIDTLEKDMTIPSNVMLTLGLARGENTKPGELTIAKDHTLTFNGSSFHMRHNGDLENTLYSKLTVAGKFVMNTEFNSVGIVEVQPGGIYELNGTLTNEQNIIVNGEMVTTADSAVYNYGTVDATNGSLKILGSWDGTDPIGNVDRNYITQTELEALLAQEAPVTLNKKVTLEKDLTLANRLYVAQGGSIVIPSGVTMTISSRMYIQQGGKVEVQSGGCLDNQDKICVYDIEGDGYLHVADASGYRAESYLNLEVYGNSTGLADVQGIDKSLQWVVFMSAKEADLRYASTLSGYGSAQVWSMGLTITQDVTVPSGLHLLVYTPADTSLGDATLRVSEGATLTVQGWLSVGSSAADSNAKLINHGTVQLDNWMAVYGSYEGKLPVMKENCTLTPMPVAKSVTFEDEQVTMDVLESSSLVLKPEVKLEDDSYPKADPQNTVTWTSSDETVIRAADIEAGPDGSYIVTACAAGTAKLTATSIYAGEKSGTVTVVVPAAFKTVSLTHEGKNDATMEMSDTPKTFSITAEGTDIFGSSMTVDGKKLKWVSSYPKLATVKVNDEGNAVVTVNANQDGVAVISATTMDASKVTGSFVLTVMDLTPRLGSAKVTLDPMDEAGALISLVESYGNKILVDEENKPVFDSNELEAVYDPDAGMLTINYTGDTLPKNKTIDSVLTVKTTGGKGEYTFNLKVALKSVQPTVTVKQAGKVDLFYTDSEAGLTVTAKGAEIESVKFAENSTPDFLLVNGMIRRNPDSTAAKPNVKAVVEVKVKGYAYPVTKNLSISTVTTKLSLDTNPTSSIINTALSEENTIRFQILDKKAKTALDLTNVTVESSVGTAVKDGNFVVIQDAAAGTILLTLRKEGWASAVTLKHKVTVSEKAPTVKLGANTLKLNNNFPEETARTTAILTQNNLDITKFSEFTCKTTSDIAVSYEKGYISASIAEGKTPKAGNYTFTATPYVGDKALADVKVKVNVSAVKPVAKLGSSSLKMNTFLAGKEAASVAVKVTNATGFNAVIDRFEAEPKEGLELNYANQVLTIRLTSDSMAKTVYQLTPIAKDDAGNEILLKEQKLTVQPYKNEKLSVSVSKKGALNSIDPSSQITYTISKVVNALGTVEKVVLEEGKDLFQLTEVTTVKGKQTFGLKMLPGKTYERNKEYSVTVNCYLYGETEDTAVIVPVVLKFKITQGNLKITAPAVQYYLSQLNRPVNVALKVATPAGGKMDTLELDAKKTSKELIKALDGQELKPDENGVLSLVIKDASQLQAGKSYKLVLNITAVGHMAGSKASQVSVTMKVMK